MGVFFVHSGLKNVYGAGEWGVSVFLIMSGFLCVNRYYPKMNGMQVDFKSNLVFAIKRISGIYWLHFALTFGFLPFYFLGTNTEHFLSVLFKYVINFLLLQAWFVIPYMSINRVSWYLSAILFCYFLFPWMLKIIDKFSKKKVICAIVFLYLFELLSAIVAAFLDCADVSFYNCYAGWVIYYHPVFRSIDFMIGCLVGKLYISESDDVRKKWKKMNNYTSLCIIGLILVLHGIYNHFNTIQIQTFGSVLIIKIISVAGFSITSCMLVYLFAKNDTKIVYIMTNKFLIFVGDMSKYMYLIHFFVFEYIGRVLWRVGGENFYKKYGVIAKLTIGLIITIVLSMIWQKFARIIKNRRYEKQSLS
ncbi:Peptidoglycan/LPS O-acetylase OafA/YrhL, contains acyltransferase and SGNH-hydrolase domains [Butyrivibrio sp. Su6]|nr:Peptidoglycan/LPS O-acetylase OafA/YrhL, contains acyltransferase and SGNH-hydrolase domains [Butyrivibrio sp. Su6]